MSTTKRNRRSLSQEGVSSSSEEIKKYLKKERVFYFEFSPNNRTFFSLGANGKVYVVSNFTEAIELADSHQDLPDGVYEATPDGRIYLTTRDNIKKTFWLAGEKDLQTILNKDANDLSPSEKLFKEEHVDFLKRLS